MKLGCALLVIVVFQLRADRFSVQEDAEAIRVSVNGNAALVYNKSLRKAPVGIEAVYDRSGYLHPLFTPKGKVITGDFSRTHPHQRGVFMAWTKVVYEGHEIDFWNLQKGTGKTEHRKVLRVGASDDRAWFEVELAHVSMLEGKARDMIKDHWRVDVSKSGDAYHVDLTSTQKMLAPGTLALSRHGYGGFGLRGAEEWVSSGETSRYWYLNDRGDDREMGNHAPARWASLYGKIDDEWASVTVLCHKDNYRSPQPVRIHPKMPYFSFTPVAAEGFLLDSGKENVSKYRIRIEDFKPNPEDLGEEWARYSGEWESAR